MREESGGWVYMLASARFDTLYIGSTRNIIRRVYEHQEGAIRGFTRKYGVKLLVWFEAHESVASAYAREKQMKEWKRAWKVALIEEKNPFWEDLYPGLAGFKPP